MTKRLLVFGGERAGVYMARKEEVDRRKENVNGEIKMLTCDGLKLT